MKKFVLIILLLQWVASPVMANDDWESWNGITFNTKISEDWSFSLLTQDRIRDDISDDYYWFMSPSLSYKLSDQWSLGVGYLYARDKNGSGKWDDEHRYIVNALWKGSWEGLRFDQRFRFEYRDYHTDPRPRYRHRFKVSLPLELIGINIVPYISEEPFYDIEDHRFNQNRASVGINVPLTEEAKLNLYYMYVSTKGSDDWRGRNVLGTQVTINF